MCFFMCCVLDFLSAFIDLSSSVITTFCAMTLNVLHFTYLYVIFYGKINICEKYELFAIKWSTIKIEKTNILHVLVNL